MVVLALLEGRAADARDAPDGAARDIGALRTPRDVPVLVEAPKPVRLAAPTPQKTGLVSV